jgi:hypothetical protein
MRTALRPRQCCSGLTISSPPHPMLKACGPGRGDTLLKVGPLDTAMPRLYETKLWRLQLPDTWSAEDGCGHELVSFFRPDGVGLLRVLTAEEQSPVQDGPGEHFHGHLSGKTWAATHGDRFIRTWALSCRGQRLWVKYSCSAANAELERSEVDGMLQSISEAT